MEITVKVKVFSDPKFCASPDGYCPRLYRESLVFFCHQFIGKNLLHKTNDYGTDIPFKCPECQEDYQKQLKIDNKSPGNCMSCSEPITPENDGINVDGGGDTFQCEDCHLIEFGERIYAMNLYFYSKKDQ